MMGFSRDEIAMTIVAPFFMSTDMFKGVQGRHVQGPDSVASRIVHAIRLNQEMVVAPWWSAWCYVIKQILPYKVNDLTRRTEKSSSEFGENFAPYCLVLHFLVGN